MLSASVGNVINTVDTTAYIDIIEKEETQVLIPAPSSLQVLADDVEILIDESQAFDHYHVQTTFWYRLQKVTVNILPPGHEVVEFTKGFYNLAGNFYLRVNEDNFEMYTENEENDTFELLGTAKSVGCARKTLKRLLYKLELLY